MLASQSPPSSFDTVVDLSQASGQPASLQRCEEVDSSRLLHGQREVLIRHGSEVYRLRHTRNDKLILTK
ncbi:hemin uptake protein HemP [Luteimonas arsenica]|uniref:hemin uptake protein HemP n=1 Tax=Luteimonas arsenica TaxID=1586242 RepID=UPI0010563709|nr:hemin uptake protein HemP [Luteimonas arsenica]